MARKNLIGISETPSPAPDAEAGRAGPPGRPIAGFVPPPRVPGQVGGITRSLSNITQKVERAEALERQLAEGQAVVELDPDLVDGSFVADRLGVSAEDRASLTAQIREHGQQVPILVRPHPDVRGRYQVAYGHRRLAAARDLRIRVKAVVRSLSDEQLIVSQGQENNARTDLSYIERALFAARLEDRGFARDTIMSALGVDKAALSRMIAVVRRLPVALIEAIGPAGAFGRRRWIELTERLERADAPDRALALAARPGFAALDTDQRFQSVFDALAERGGEEGARAEPWIAPDRSSPLKIREGRTETIFAVSRKSAPGFDDFLRGKLAGLYDEYRAARKAGQSSE
ncbi:plasmid partitioning protein RepB [Ensifer soli]|uniref:plasmid partitioning protein RepB n=1 Tax=Ciceribacter sp. sgz301302 TaxID=3342379 RepID=UPI0035B829A5